MTLTVESILLSLASAVVGGLIVAFANHLMTLGREREKKATEIRIEYLIDCCLQIERVSNLPSDIDFEQLEKSYEAIERAVAKIMLLGDLVEVDAVRKFAKAFASNKSALTDEILDSLRNSLRKKLGLESAGKWDTFLRIRLRKP